MNVKDKRVELRSSKFTESTDALQMGADFISAFAMGFDIDDAIALLRLDSLNIQSFDIKDVRQTLGACRTSGLSRIRPANTGQGRMRLGVLLVVLLERTGYVVKKHALQERIVADRLARKPSLPLRMVR